MTSPESTSSRLLAYGTLACGATAMLSGNAEAATVVTINSASYDTGLATLGTVSATNKGYPNKGYLHFSGTGVAFPNGTLFHRGNDSTVVTPSGSAGTNFQFSNNGPVNGALANSSDNWFYAFGSTDNSQRVWLQLHFGNSSTTDFSIVTAVIPTSAGELPSASAAAAAVPETSSLALLSLGAAGLLKRRRRAA